MIRHIILLFAFFCLLTPDLSGQYEPKNSKKQFYGNQRIHKPLYRWVTGDYSKHGLQFSFGPTYTFTSPSSNEGVLSTAGDSSLHYTHETRGRIGIFAEIGMTHITRKPRKLIHYYDWSIGYKHLGGKDLFSADVYDSRDSLVGNVEGEGKFYNGYLYGRFSVHSVFQMNPHLFLDNAIGVNGDYGLVGKNKSYEGYPSPMEQQFQGDLLVQLHYDFGFGIKPRVDKGFFFIPGVRVPILGAHEWRGGTPAIHWFSGKYFPALFKLKFVWLFKKDPNDCPPVEVNEKDRERSKQYQNQ